MPKLNKIRRKGRIYARKRWYAQSHSSEKESLSGDDIKEYSDDNVEFIRFIDKCDVDGIGELLELINDEIGLRLVSVLLYMSLRYFGIKYDTCNEFFKAIGELTSKTAQKWFNVFLCGDFDEFISEGRGGKHIPSFYNVFPDTELLARDYAIQRCGAKPADFDAFELANFIDEKFYMLTGIDKNPKDSLIRSVQSCRLDLRRCGARFEANSKRPYFEDHEREDVVEHRIKFLQNFLSKEDSYYLISEGDEPRWQKPTSGTPIILICKVS